MNTKITFRSVLAGATVFAASTCAVMAADAPTKTVPVPLASDVANRGATIEEVHAMQPVIARTPDEAIYQVKIGNARYFGGATITPELSANERRAQIISQSPFVSVIGCADSRVPVEMIFDQGPGSVFVARVAGNIVDPGTAGSMEYAVAALNSPLLIVLGHEGCGAVKAAMMPAAEQAKLPANVRYLLGKISPGLQNVPKIRDDKAKMREAVIANVRLQTYRLSQNPTVASAIKAGKTKVVGAYYEISSGAVDFLETPEALRLTPDEMKVAQADVKRLLAAAPAHDHDHAAH